MLGTNAGYVVIAPTAPYAVGGNRLWRPDRDAAAVASTLLDVAGTTTGRIDRARVHATGYGSLDIIFEPFARISQVHPHPHTPVCSALLSAQAYRMLTDRGLRFDLVSNLGLQVFDGWIHDLVVTLVSEGRHSRARNCTGYG